MTVKLTETDISALMPDDKNFNKGTQYGEHLMDKSLRKFGLGRSILIDRNNRIIAGNKTAEKAADNATGKANLSFDTELIFEEVGNLDFTPEDWGIELPESVPLEGGDEEGEGKVTMTVTCDDSRMMLNLFDELRDSGFACELKGG